MTISGTNSRNPFNGNCAECALNENVQQLCAEFGQERPGAHSAEARRVFCCDCTPSFTTEGGKHLGMTQAERASGCCFGWKSGMAAGKAQSFHIPGGIALHLHTLQ